MTYRPFLTLAVVGGVALTLALGLRAFGNDDVSHADVAPMGAKGVALPTGRTVRLSWAMPKPPQGDVLDAKLVRGSMPDGTTSAVVISDTHCTPDARGISRCLDRLRLTGGRVITVRHVHDMRIVPCLTPGERVRVTPARRDAA